MAGSCLFCRPPQVQRRGDEPAFDGLGLAYPRVRFPPHVRFPGSNARCSEERQGLERFAPTLRVRSGVGRGKAGSVSDGNVVAAHFYRTEPTVIEISR